MDILGSGLQLEQVDVPYELNWPASQQTLPPSIARLDPAHVEQEDAVEPAGAYEVPPEQNEHV